MTDIYDRLFKIRDDSYALLRKYYAGIGTQSLAVLLGTAIIIGFLVNAHHVDYLVNPHYVRWLLYGVFVSFGLAFVLSLLRYKLEADMLDAAVKHSSTATKANKADVELKRNRLRSWSDALEVFAVVGTILLAAFLLTLLHSILTGK